MKDKMTKLCTVKSIDNDRGVISFVLTQRQVDRDSEVIEPAGGRLENYKKNPVFLWAHNITAPSIGRVIPETLKVSKEQITGDVEFDLDDPFAALIYNKYKKKHLNAGSIRFMPVAYDKEPVLPGQKGLTFTKWELLEFSAVPVPANAGALVQDVKELCDLVENGACEKSKLESIAEFAEELKSFSTNEMYEKSAYGWLEYINRDSEESIKLLPEDEPWNGQKPYPNEHACRLHDPSRYSKFRRQKRKSGDKEYFAIIGFRKSDGKSEDQTYRYPVKTWTKAQAEKHCTEHHGIKFEPAKKEKSIIEFPAEMLEELHGKMVYVNYDENGEVTLEPADFGVKFLDDYDFTKWEDVAEAMNILLKLEETKTPKHIRTYVYNELVKFYKQFGKEPPEFTKVQSLVQPKSFEELVNNQDVLEQVVLETIRQLNKTQEK